MLFHFFSTQPILKEIKDGKEAFADDRRDFARLIYFFDWDEHNYFGISLKPKCKQSFQPKEWTRENILAELEGNLAFGFEKALGKRGLSAADMYGVVKMWLWILEDELQHMTEYENYGLPLFKAVAITYGFENPIGNDCGNEWSYSTYGDLN